MALEYHEPPEELSAETRDLHRAVASLIEELEALDWYQTRADLSSDTPLKEILLHNRNEELEHAAMLIEWLRRRIPDFDTPLRNFLFTDKPLIAEEADTPGPSAPPNGLQIGRLK